ncbi:unnamed protein product [Protopolystoma xenopodis]|uniref:Uncharacterized protein n=1 Tax=Protopolystoma xenopodis TaxID=117903 RepID=A0A448XKN5_9PLAT|nr:unnamed protein product [Protopolystoma xenopodis]
MKVPLTMLSQEIHRNQLSLRIIQSGLQFRPRLRLSNTLNRSRTMTMQRKLLSLSHSEEWFPAASCFVSSRVGKGKGSTLGASARLNCEWNRSASCRSRRGCRGVEECRPASPYRFAQIPGPKPSLLYRWARLTLGLSCLLIRTTLPRGSVVGC